ncbi:MAG: heparinase II/III domain-containing protein [Planctomycetota bacterium]
MSMMQGMMQRSASVRAARAALCFLAAVLSQTAHCKEADHSKETEPVTRYFSRYFDAERPHPYLLVSPAQLKETARRLFDERETFLVAAHEAVSSNAEPDAPATNRRRSRRAERTLNAAYLSALYRAAGREEDAEIFARRAYAALVAFGEMGVSEHREGTGFLDQNYLICLAFAYDLVWDFHGWTDVQRESLERMFYSDMDELRVHMHRKHLSNHAAWCQARLATTALLFKNEALAAECLDGPDSYPTKLAHAFFDDGLNYEQSLWQYHVYSVLPVTITALAARGAGAEPDPVMLVVPNDKSLFYAGGTTGDYTMPFYPADENLFPRPDTKDLHVALTAQFDILRPDTTCPSTGDYGGPTPPLSDHCLAELAWDLFGDERAARLLKGGQRRASRSYPLPEHLLTLAFGRPLPDSPKFETKSAIYPHAGYAVMKSIEGDAYWGSDSIHAVLVFGPFGNGHGHADKLHLGISGAGRKCCIEELHRRGAEWQYFNSTVSHNTVVVGAKSQPGNEEMFTTGIDSCGRLVYRRFDDDIKVACAEDPNVYEGLEVYRRTVAVTDSYIVDVFEVRSAEETTFDWFLHGMGDLGVEGAAMEGASLGAASQGYEYLRDAKGGRSGGPFSARFSCGHTVFAPAQGEVLIFSAVGPWKKDTGRPVLVLRKSGREAVFTVVHDPSGKAVSGVRSYERAGCVAALEISVSGRVDRLELPANPDEMVSPGSDVVYLKTGAAP